MGTLWNDTFVHCEDMLFFYMFNKELTGQELGRYWLGGTCGQNESTGKKGGGVRRS